MLKFEVPQDWRNPFRVEGIDRVTPRVEATLGFES